MANSYSPAYAKIGKVSWRAVRSMYVLEKTAVLESENCHAQGARKSCLEAFVWCTPQISRGIVAMFD